MIYCLCSNKDDCIIKTFDSFILAMVYNIVFNDYSYDGFYLMYLNV